MSRNFKILSTHKEVDLFPYIKDYIKEYPETEIIVSCDSQNKKDGTVYAIVIGLYRPKKGGHVLYTRFETLRERTNATRLLKEVEYSIEVAESLIKNQLPRAKFIDLDLNPDPMYKSNEVIRIACGWCEGLGYKVRHKGNFPMLSYAADSIVK